MLNHKKSPAGLASNWYSTNVPSLFLLWQVLLARPKLTVCSASYVFLESLFSIYFHLLLFCLCFLNCFFSTCQESQVTPLDFMSTPPPARLLQSAPLLSTFPFLLHDLHAFIIARMPALSDNSFPASVIPRLVT